MKWIVLLFLFGFKLSVGAQDTIQSSRFVVINNINITGNNKTKNYIILRELSFTQGDTIKHENLQQKLVLAKEQIINTSLFLKVDISTQNIGENKLDVNIQVIERWYFLPIPYFVLVDRNFNQWWTEEHHSLQRVNYGLKLIQNNVSGRNDNTYLWLINGYNHQIAARYELPFIDKKLRHGISFAASYLNQRELNYATSANDKQLFYDGNYFLRQQLRAEVSYLYRPAIKTKHSFTFRIVDEKLNDTILRLNPAYFPYGRTHITFPQITYSMQYSNADNIVYPTKGFVGDASFIKKGLGGVMNLWQATYHAKYTIPLYNKTSLQLQAAGLLSLPFKQPFFNKQIVNYIGDFFVQGLEYYVIDGVAATINRATLRQQIFSYKIKNPVRIKTLEEIPVRLFLKGYGNAAYVYDNAILPSRFNNKIITTYGVGLDIVTIYDVVLRVEYSFNQLGNHNFYLHSKNDF